MENTAINKAKFLLICYANNRDSIKSIHGKGCVFSILDILNNPDEFYAELTPLSAITDEDAKKVCEIFDVSYRDSENEAHFDLAGALEWINAFYTEPAGYYVDGYTGNQLLFASDFLRSKGYALPFHRLSVEDLISYGWVKLKTN